MISPISLGLKVVDQDQKPIIYHDEVREVLFDFIRKKVNLQYQELRVKNLMPLYGSMIRGWG